MNIRVCTCYGCDKSQVCGETNGGEMVCLECAKKAKKILAQGLANTEELINRLEK